jgi:hypothetical protein
MAGFGRRDGIAGVFGDGEVRLSMSKRKIRSIIPAGVSAIAFAGVASGSAVPISYLVQDFNGSVTADSDIGPQSAAANATASQTSSLGDTGFSASGSVVADSVFGTDGPANSAGGSVFHITFNVAQAESYVFSADLTGSKDLSELGATSSLIQLMDGAGNNIFAPITSVNLSGFTLAGTLDPGTYSLALDVKATSDDESKNFVNYSVSFADGPETPTGSTGGVIVSNPVPLPSSGLGAIVMLSCLGAYGLVRRRLPG